MRRLQNLAVLTSGILGFIIPTYFAWTVYRDNIPQNVATWGMIFALDLLGLILVYQEGNKKPYLQLGWTLASVAVLTAIFQGGNPWSWGLAETISLLIFAVAVFLWRVLSARVAIYAYMVSMYVSSVPLIISTIGTHLSPGQPGYGDGQSPPAFSPSMVLRKRIWRTPSCPGEQYSSMPSSLSSV